MKNTFPLIAVCLALADEQAYDATKGISLTDEQLKLIEDALKASGDLKTANEQKITALEADKTALEADKTANTAEIARLKALVDNATAMGGGQNANDPKQGGEQSFEDKIANDPFYQELEKKGYKM